MEKTAHGTRRKAQGMWLSRRNPRALRLKPCACHWQLNLVVGCVHLTLLECLD